MLFSFLQDVSLPYKMKIIFLGIILKNYLARVLGMALPEISDESLWVMSMNLPAFPRLLPEINFPSSVSCSNRQFQAILCPRSLTEWTRYGLVTSEWPGMEWSISYVWSHVEEMRYSSTYQLPILIMQIRIMERFFHRWQIRKQPTYRMQPTKCDIWSEFSLTSSQEYRL